MNAAVIKSYLRSLLAAAIAALGVVLTTSADITLKAVLVAVGAAVVPVIIRWLDPSETAFGRTTAAPPDTGGDGGAWDVGNAVGFFLALLIVLVFLKVFDLIH